VDPALQALFSQQLKEVGFSLLVPSTELQAIVSALTKSVEHFWSEPLAAKSSLYSETQQRAIFVSYGEIKTELKVETKPGQGPATLTRFPELGLCIEKACSNIENLLANLMAILMEQNGVTASLGEPSYEFKAFHYFNTRTDVNYPCVDHQDWGALTVIPLTDVCALQLLLPKDSTWINIEEQYPPGTLLVFSGIQWELLSGQPGLVHRVKNLSGMPRSSLTFMSSYDRN